MELNKYYVYIWYKVDNEEIFYVGKGSGNRYKSLKDRNSYFKNIVKKYECKSKIIKDNMAEDEAYQFELEYGLKLKEKGLAKASYILGKANQFVSKTTRKKISDTLKGHISWNKGKKLTPEHIEKMRQWHLGKNLSYQHKNNIRLALLGKERPQEVKNKLSASKIGSKNPMYGKPQSEKQKQALLKANIGRKCSEETKRSVALAQGKKVNQINPINNELIATFESAMEASRILGCNNSKISRVCRGERKTHFGFSWEYTN